LVNAQHIKAVPGRKTDLKDCQWIAELLQHGLLHGSFVPPTPIRQLRDLTRMRASLRQDHTAIANRMQKILEDANIKLASVASDWLGVSGRAILAQLLAGREAHSPASTPAYGGVPSAGPRLDEVGNDASPPKHADSFAPNYRPDRSLRLRRAAADRHAARCASRDLCSGVRPSAPYALGRGGKETG
jgi:hypothetical protein